MSGQEHVHARTAAEWRSDRTHCGGTRVAQACTAWPRFRVSSQGSLVLWCCGHHLTRAVTLLDVQHVRVEVYE